MQLSCTYEMTKWRQNLKVYTCKIENAQVPVSNSIIKRKKGSHLKGKNDKSIQGVEIANSAFHFIPNNFAKFFPHITCLDFNGCGLKEVARKNFDGLEGLQQLFFNDNELTSLPPNLLEGFHSLKFLSFNGNKNLKTIDPTMLLPVKDQILSVDFRNTKYLDHIYQPGHKKTVDTLEELMDIISKNCKPGEVQENDENLVVDENLVESPAEEPENVGNSVVDGQKQAIAVETSENSENQKENAAEAQEKDEKQDFDGIKQENPIEDQQDEFHSPPAKKKKVSFEEELKCNEKMLSADASPKTSERAQSTAFSELMQTAAEAATARSSTLWHLGVFSDVSVKVGNKKFPLHKAILIQASQFFADYFFEDQEKTEIEISGRPEVVKAALRYVYTQELPGAEKDIDLHELYSVAEKLDLKSLMEALKSQINADILNIAQSLNV